MNIVQRRQQLGRIHAAAKTLGLEGDAYRDLLESLTGLRSCADMDDRQVNHVLDWLNWMAGRRPLQPRSFSRHGADAHANLTRVCYAIQDCLPPGYERPPMRSQTWLIRTAGRPATGFEEYTPDELWRLIEGLKAIYKRGGQRRSETLDELPLLPQMDAVPEPITPFPDSDPLFGTPF